MNCDDFLKTFLYVILSVFGGHFFVHIAIGAEVQNEIPSF